MFIIKEIPKLPQRKEFCFTNGSFNLAVLPPIGRPERNFGILAKGQCYIRRLTETFFVCKLHTFWVLLSTKNSICFFNIYFCYFMFLHFPTLYIFSYLPFINVLNFHMFLSYVGNGSSELLKKKLPPKEGI